MLLRTDPHGNPIWNQDVAGLPKGMGAFCGSIQMEGLGFNLYVAPADSLSPSISEDLLVGGFRGFQREKMVMILVDIRNEV